MLLKEYSQTIHWIFYNMLIITKDYPTRYHPVVRSNELAHSRTGIKYFQWFTNRD